MLDPGLITEPQTSTSQIPITVANKPQFVEVNGLYLPSHVNVATDTVSITDVPRPPSPMASGSEEDDDSSFILYMDDDDNQKVSYPVRF